MSDTHEHGDKHTAGDSLISIMEGIARIQRAAPGDLAQNAEDLIEADGIIWGIVDDLRQRGRIT